MPLWIVDADKIAQLVFSGIGGCPIEPIDVRGVHIVSQPMH
jgi:hypothetical protein